MTAALALLAMREATPVADLPFEHLPGRILLRGTLNGQAATVALDSGASATVSDERAAVAAGATRGANVEATGNGAAKVAAWRAEGLTLGLDGSGLRLAVPFAVPLGEVNAKAARPLDAILGCDLLRRFAVEVDYVQDRIRIFEPTGYTLPRGAKASPLQLAKGRPVVQGALDVAGLRLDRLTMLIDSGLSAGIDLGPDFIARSGLGDRVEGDATGGVAGLGGAAQSRTVLGATGRVGGVRFAGGLRLILTPSASWKAYDAKVGDEFLSHYDVAFDLPHGRLYLRPNGK